MHQRFQPMGRNLLIVTLVSISSLSSHTHTHTHTPRKPVYHFGGASLVAQMVKNLPTMQDTQVCSLGEEDTLEKGMATHSCILPSPRIQGKPCHLHEKASRETDSQNCSGSPCRSSIDLYNYHESQGKARTLRMALGLP